MPSCGCPRSGTTGAFSDSRPCRRSSSRLQADTDNRQRRRSSSRLQDSLHQSFMSIPSARGYATNFARIRSQLLLYVLRSSVKCIRPSSKLQYLVFKSTLTFNTHSVVPLHECGFFRHRKPTALAFGRHSLCVVLRGGRVQCGAHAPSRHLTWPDRTQGRSRTSL